MSRNLTFEKLVEASFYFILLASLSSIWLNKYFITGDGPSHLYNSKVLLDFVTSSNVEFYREYYSINRDLDPNWSGHIILAGLLYIFPYYLAEKVFITLYVLLFSFSLRALIKEINPENGFLIVLGMPFIYQFTFRMGFYNYSLSFAFCFLSIWFWLKYHQKFQFYHFVIYLLINTVLYFTHPIGFLLSVLVVGIVNTINVLCLAPLYESPHKSLPSKIQIFFKPLFSFFPGLLLLVAYLQKQGTSTALNEVRFTRLFQEFIELTSLVNLNSSEEFWAILLAVLFGIMLVYSIISHVKNFHIKSGDGFFLVFIITFLVYFLHPSTFTGAGVLSIRLQFIPYLTLLLWFSSIDFPQLFKKVILATTLVIATAFIWIRQPQTALASDAVEEYLEVAEHIEAHSTVLPLSFSHNGKTPEGELITKRIWLFMHVSDYLGAIKPSILLGNYEGNTGYFPIDWKPEMNPFRHLSSNEGLEFQPPSVDIDNYQNKTGSDIDYVILWCLDEQYMSHEYTVNILEQLSANYEMTFASENNLVQLYRKKRVHNSNVEEQKNPK
ncbi:MAG: hypothetical protein RJQ09_03880 [Cyclobacteriaceae bacterium]